MIFLEESLQNFPRKTEDAFDRLQTIVDKKLETAKLNRCEKERLKEELAVIKATGTASVFVFFHDTVYALKEIKPICYGVMHCSYLCYFLGLTKVNPFDYDLPFERYYGRNRKHLPFCCFAVETGKKGRVIRYLKEQYGVDKVVRIKDMENEYLLSSKSLREVCDVERTFLQFSSDEEKAWCEDISSLTLRDASRLNLYTLTVEEAEIGEYRRFSGEEIYRKTLSCFTNEFRDFHAMEKYKGIEEAEEIFSSTDGKFVYQEQFFEICTKLLGVSNQKADEFRKDLLKRKKQSMEDVRALFSWKLGEQGVALFDYINNGFPYAVCKAYVIGLTFLDFKKNF